MGVQGGNGTGYGDRATAQTSVAPLRLQEQTRVASSTMFYSMASIAGIQNRLQDETDVGMFVTVGVTESQEHSGTGLLCTTPKTRSPLAGTRCRGVELT